MQTTPHRPLPRLLWAAWTAYAHRAAGYQTQALLNVAYYVVFGPSALAARGFDARLLDDDGHRRASYWLRRSPTNGRLEDLERQF